MSNKKTNSAFKIAIILLILIPHLFIIFAHKNIVLNWFSTDDAFYYFKTAQNIVEGKGVSFDGISLTNGFHPLWMILVLPVFVLTKIDLILPLRLVIALQVLLGIFSALLIFELSKEIFSRWVGFLLAMIWTFTPQIYDVVFQGGTEAGLNAFSLILFGLFFYRVSENLTNKQFRIKDIFGLSIAAIIVLFSRLDNVFYVFIAGGWLLLRFRTPTGEKQSSISGTIKWWSRIGSAYFIPLSTALGSYMLLNLIFFNSAMPVSGKVKQWWGILYYTVYGRPPISLEETIENFFSADNSKGPWSLVISPAKELFGWLDGLSVANQWILGLVILVIVGSILWILFLNRKKIVEIFFRWNLAPVFLACLVQFYYYDNRMHVAIREWYWILEYLFIILFFTIILGIVIQQLLDSTNKPIIAPIITIIMVTYVFFPYSQYPAKVLDYNKQDEKHFYLSRADWLVENTEPGSIIGMTGSGSTGYFASDRTIVNLDGLISSQEYFEHLKNETADQYLEEIGLDYVFGNAYILKQSIPYQSNFGERLQKSQVFNFGERRIVLFHFDR